MACLGFFIAIGQEAPPAFERSGNAEEEAVEEPLDEHDPFDPMLYAPKFVRVQVEHIEVSHKDLTRLMMEDTSVVSNAKPLRMKVQELVEKDKAKVFETQIVVCRSGQKATTESIQEFIYPVEYEPWNSLPPVEGEKTEPPPPSSPLNPAMPCSFETRHLGSMLEVEATIGENEIGDNKRLIDLRLSPDMIWHTGNRVWSEIKDESGNVIKVSMPDLYKLAISTSVTCISGQYVLVGALSPKTEKGEVDRERKIMVFVKCDVLAVVP